MTDTPKRVRLVAATIQLELVIDDGDQLHPLVVDPVRLPASEVAGFDAAAAIAGVQARLDAAEPDPDA